MEGSQELQSLGRSLAAQRALYLLLTTSLPEEEELEGALKDGDFRLIRRSGFVQAELSTAMKKRSQYFLSAGAVLQAPFQGALYQVGHTGAHPVYRYGRPLLLGGGRMKELGHLQVYDLILRTRTPLFVGSGKKYVKKEYLFDPKGRRASFLKEDAFFSC